MTNKKIIQSDVPQLTKSGFMGILIGGGGDFIVATGGDITTDGDYKVHKFTSSGTFEITSGTGDVEYLVISGGGGGNRGNAGGGGSGAFRTDTKSDMEVGEYTVTIGAKGIGGYGGSEGTPATGGGTSVFDDISLTGGGAGGGEPSCSGCGPEIRNGQDSTDGSGGGSGASSLVGGSSGTYGNNGGTSGDPAGAGGGGSGAVGGNGSGDTGGDGGAGTSSDIIENGTDVTDLRRRRWWKYR